jgi:hypothetical protein
MIIESLNKNRYLLVVIILLPLLLLFLIIYIRLPAKITIYKNYIQLRNTLIKWEEIDNILFTVDKTGPFIKIKTREQNFTVFWRHYQDNDELRKLLEGICIEKSINYVIEDRGSLG